MAITALDGVVSVQLDDHFSLSPGLDGGFAAVSGDVNVHAALFAGVNVHTAQGDIGRAAGIRVDGDGVGGGFGGLGNDGRAVIHRVVGAVGHSLPAFRGIHGNASLGNVIGSRKSRQGHGGCQQQRHHTGKNSSRFHGVFVSFLARKRTLLPGRRGFRIWYTHPRYHCSRKTGFREYPSAGKNG